jgi:hypothetical protein
MTLRALIAITLAAGVLYWRHDRRRTARFDRLHALTCSGHRGHGSSSRRCDGGEKATQPPTVAGAT